MLFTRNRKTFNNPAIEKAELCGLTNMLLAATRVIFPLNDLEALFSHRVAFVANIRWLIVVAEPVHNEIVAVGGPSFGTSVFLLFLC